MFYGLISLTGYWAGPVNTQPVIQLSPSALPKYAMFSVGRIVAAYLISLVVTLVYAYFAAHNARQILAPDVGGSRIKRATNEQRLPVVQCRRHPRGVVRQLFEHRRGCQHRILQPAAADVGREGDGVQTR